MTPDVGDYELGKSRLCAKQCSTCIFRPGNPVMSAERLGEFTAEVVLAQSFIPCHSTYPPLAPAGAKPAICRGFFNRHKTRTLRLMEVMWGFVEVEPPSIQQERTSR